MFQTSASRHDNMLRLLGNQDAKAHNQKQPINNSYRDFFCYNNNVLFEGIQWTLLALMLIVNQSVAY